MCSWAPELREQPAQCNGMEQLTQGHWQAEPSSQPSSSSAVSGHGPTWALKGQSPRATPPRPSSLWDLVLSCLGGPASQTDGVAQSSPTPLAQGSSQPQAGLSWGLQGHPGFVSCLGLNLNTTTFFGSEKSNITHQNQLLTDHAQLEQRLLQHQVLAALQLQQALESGGWNQPMPAMCFADISQSRTSSHPQRISVRAGEETWAELSLSESPFHPSMG